MTTEYVYMEPEAAAEWIRQQQAAGMTLDVEQVGADEPEHPTQEQRYRWANARTAAALLTGAPYVYLTDPDAAHGDDLYGDLILITWRGQEIVCPVPVVVEMLHPDPYAWYGEPDATVPGLIGYPPTEYRERE